MNSNFSIKLLEQIKEMKLQEVGWETEKKTIQSTISSLKQEENQWMSLKESLLSRLRILRSAAAADPLHRQEILEQLSNLPSIQLYKPVNINEKKQNQIEEPKLNENNNEDTNVQKQNPSPLVSFGRVRKNSSKELKKRKNISHKMGNDSSAKLDSQNSPFSEKNAYNVKCLLSQHLDCVRCAAFHPTLPYIATGSDDGSIRITNLDPPKKPRIRHHPIQIMSLRGHSGAVLALASYHNNLISSDVNGQVCVWDFSESKSTMHESHGRVDHHLIYYSNDHTDAVWSIATNENVPYFVTASSDKTIRIHDFQTQKSTPVTITEGPTVVSFNSDGSIFIVGCLDGHIHIFENKQKTGYFDFQSCVMSICHSITKNQMFIACEDKNIKVFDITDRKVTKQIIAHELYASAMTLTADGQYLVTTSPDKTIRIWDVPDLNVISADSHHQPKYGEAGLCMAATLPTNSHDYFASGGADGVVKIFEKSK